MEAAVGTRERGDNMTTRTLLDIVKDRVESAKCDPTEEAFFREIRKALEQLIELEREAGG